MVWERKASEEDVLGADLTRGRTAVHVTKFRHATRWPPAKKNWPPDTRPGPLPQQLQLPFSDTTHPPCARRLAHLQHKTLLSNRTQFRMT